MLLRNLLEAWAHLAFIAGIGAPDGTIVCRGVRFELGALKEAEDVARRVGALPPEIVQRFEIRRAELRAVETGCTCGRHQPLPEDTLLRP